MNCFPMPFSGWVEAFHGGLGPPQSHKAAGCSGGLFSLADVPPNFVSSFPCPGACPVEVFDDQGISRFEPEDRRGELFE